MLVFKTKHYQIILYEVLPANVINESLICIIKMNLLSIFPQVHLKRSTIGCVETKIINSFLKFSLLILSLFFFSFSIPDLHLD